MAYTPKDPSWSEVEQVLENFKNQPTSDNRIQLLDILYEWENDYNAQQKEKNLDPQDQKYYQTQREKNQYQRENAEQIEIEKKALMLKLFNSSKTNIDE